MTRIFSAILGGKIFLKYPLEWYGNGLQPIFEILNFRQKMTELRRETRGRLGQKGPFLGHSSVSTKVRCLRYVYPPLNNFLKNAPIVKWFFAYGSKKVGLPIF